MNLVSSGADPNVLNRRGNARCQCDYAKIKADLKKNDTDKLSVVDKFFGTELLDASLATLNNLSKRIYAGMLSAITRENKFKEEDPEKVLRK